MPPKQKKHPQKRAVKTVAKAVARQVAAAVSSSSSAPRKRRRRNRKTRSRNNNSNAPLSAGLGSMKEFGPVKHNSLTSEKRAKQHFILDDYEMQLPAPSDTSLQCVWYGNLQPGLIPMDDSTAVAANGIGPVIQNPTTNSFGISSRASLVSKAYDSYEDLNIELIFEPEVSQFSQAGSAGLVYLHFEPDPAESTLSTTAGILRSDSRFHVHGLSSQTLVLRIPAKYLRKRKYYVRTGALPPNSSINDFDAGRFSVFTSGVNGSTALGTLRVKGSLNFCDAIDPNEATSLQVPAPNCYILGKTTSQLPTSLITDTGFTVLQTPTWATGNFPIGEVVSSIVLPPGNYIATMYSNVLFTATNPLAEANLSVTTTLLADSFNGSAVHVAFCRTAADFEATAGGVMDLVHSCVGTWSCKPGQSSTFQWQTTGANVTNGTIFWHTTSAEYPGAGNIGALLVLQSL